MSRALYEERLKRIETAAHLGVPDRVPVVLGIDFFSARHKGMKISEFIWGGERAVDVMLETALELGVDGVLMSSPPHPAALVVGVWPTKMRLPGRELGEDELWQFDETVPTMTVDDYDFIIKNGWNAFIPTLIERCIDYMPPQDVFKKLMELGEAGLRAAEKFRENGIVTFIGGSVNSPFEIFSAARTIGEFYKDLYRYPQKVLDAMNAALPDFIEATINTTKAGGVKRIFLGGTRGAGAMISLQKYEKFYHPFLRQMVDAFVDAGLEVMLHFDQDWTLNLPYFKDFPAGKVSLHTDGFTDIFKAKEILGGHIALKGDVHPTMLTLGTPEEVDAYCKRLIEEVGKDGGFILAQGCDVPIDARFENVKAMVDAAHKYGVYRK